MWLVELVDSAWRTSGLFLIRQKDITRKERENDSFNAYKNKREEKWHLWKTFSDFIVDRSVAGGCYSRTQLILALSGEVTTHGVKPLMIPSSF